MDYLAFLTRWFNLPFAGALLVGMVWVVHAVVRGRSEVRLGATLLGAGLTGLTWNGALHDLALGSPAPRFPLVLVASVAIGWWIGKGATVLKSRWPRAVEDVTLDREDLEGRVARLVSQIVDEEPGSGRAQWLDEAGVLHLVRCHTEAAHLRFGQKVLLGAFDPQARSYCIRRVTR